MSLASSFNEHEYFSLNDVMAITGESKEELLQRIEQCRQELIEAGENPDEYFKPIEPQRTAVYYLLLFTPQPESGCAVKNNGIRPIESSPLAKGRMHGKLHSLALTRQRVSGQGVKSNYYFPNSLH